MQSSIKLMLKHKIKIPFSLIVKDLYFALTSLIDLLIPKSNNLVLFSAFSGLKYRDNPKYLFTNFIKHYGNEVTVKWVTKEKRVYQQIADEYSEDSVILMPSLKGFWLLLRAKTIFISHGLSDIPFFKPSGRKKIIHLYHAISLKKIGFLQHNLGESNYCKNELLKSIIKLYKIKSQKKIFARYNYIISSSDIDRYAVSCCFNISPKRVVVTGLPRNDIFADPHSINNPFGNLPETGKIILYAPTFRDNAPVKVFPFEDLDIRVFYKFCCEKDIFLVLRTHISESASADDFSLLLKEMKGRLIDGSLQRYEDVQENLPYVDILITDYSSIYLDFLLLDRPIIFIPYDLEQYTRERGLLYDYHSVTPGPKISSQKELMDLLTRYLENPQLDREKRMMVKNLFHKYNDFRAYERIYELVNKKHN